MNFSNLLKSHKFDVILRNISTLRYTLKGLIVKQRKNIFIAISSTMLSSSSNYLCYNLEAAKR